MKEQEMKKKKKSAGTESHGNRLEIIKATLKPNGTHEEAKCEVDIYARVSGIVYVCIGYSDRTRRLFNVYIST